MKNQQKENRYTPAYYKQAQGSNAISQTNVSSKKLWTIIVLALALISAVVASLCIALHKEVIPSNITSSSTTQDTSDLTIKNANFKYTYADGQNLQYPLVANNWTIKNTSTPNSVAMGVLDTADWDKVVADMKAHNIFTDTEKTNPYYPTYNADDGFDTENSRIFMIKKDAAIESDAATVISNSFTIDSGEYMKISVWVRTIDVVGNGAFIALKNSSSGTASSNYYCVYHISTSTATVVENNWARYDFYVEGNKFSSKTIYLELGLGRKLSTNNVTESASGLIYFTGIEANNISRGEYNAHEQETLDITKNYISYSFYTDESNVTLSDWSQKTDEHQNKEIVGQLYNTITYRNYEYKVGDGHMPFHYDPDTTEGDELYIYEVRPSTPVKFAQFAVNPPSIAKCYRLSMWIRTEIVPSSGAYIYLNAYDKNGNYVKASSAHFAGVQTSSDIENDTYNGWTEYQFYIQPNETDVYYFELEVSVGKRNATTTSSDMAYIAEIELYELEQHEYYSITSSDTINAISLKSEINPSDSLTNGSFNNSSTSAESSTFPVTPSGWDMIFAGSSNIVEEYDEANLAPNRSSAFWPKENPEDPEQTYSSIGGILYSSLNSSIYAPYGVAPSSFAGYADDDAHCLLMIHNNQFTACGYKSAGILLTSKSFYRISVLAKGIQGNVPYIYLTDGAKKVHYSSTDSVTNEYIGETYTEMDKTLSNGWVRYYIYIATGDTDKTVYLELWNGKRDALPTSGYATGTVLFDQAECKLLDLGDSKVNEEYAGLFETDDETTPYASTSASLEMIYNEQQTVTTTAKNLFVLDYRYNDTTIENDFDRVYNYSTEVRNKEKELADNEDKTELNAMMSKLEALVNDFNAKHYNNATEGTYYINWAENNKNIGTFRTYLNSIKNAEEDKEDTEEETETAPVDWLVVSSLIVTVAMLAGIVGIIIRKFVSIRKKSEVIENNYVAG